MSDATKIALLFPGQGSQTVGMGRNFYDNYPAARAVFDEADEALGFALSKLIFEGPEDQLKLTEHTQPAILTVSVAAWRALAPELESRGLSPAFAAGHSLGEYSAHVAACTFSFADAVRTVRLRGQYMQQAVPAGEGAMAAILGLDAERINDICAKVSDELTQAPPQNPADPAQQAFAAVDAVADPNNSISTPVEAASRVSAVVSPANLNSPDQTVISGTVAAVTLAAERCKEAGAKRAKMLAVSAPFHCALMQPAQEEVARVLAGLSMAEPEFPVAANVTGGLVTTAESARDALIRQVTGAVRWVDCMHALIGAGAEVFVEAGPGKVLCGLLKQIDPAQKALNVEDAASLEKTLADLAG